MQNGNLSNYFPMLVPGHMLIDHDRGVRSRMPEDFGCGLEVGATFQGERGPGMAQITESDAPGDAGFRFRSFPGSLE